MAKPLLPIFASPIPPAMHGIQITLSLCFAALVAQGLGIPELNDRRLARGVGSFRFKRLHADAEATPTAHKAPIVIISDVPGAPWIPISPTPSRDATAVASSGLPTAVIQSVPYGIPGVPGSLSRNATSSPTAHASSAEIPGAIPGAPTGIPGTPAASSNSTIAGASTANSTTAHTSTATSHAVTDVPGAPLVRRSATTHPVTDVPGAPTIASSSSATAVSTGPQAASGIEYTCSGTGLPDATGVCCTGFGSVGTPIGCTTAPSPFVCGNSFVAACLQSANRTILATTANAYGCPVAQYPVEACCDPLNLSDCTSAGGLDAFHWWVA
ncbi:hypothetical protein CALVIDRAFT_536631 [Calocera viscosa TUFC12733]|uniref:Hydrophobin n=1 Tax=Calocera viscosa (strain TUFC12733) TaxID=1330018 RepID=A0A167MY25_CALVF|nr:hypothetical protein CALVIDRAFT_536631 [Calocera viscosa TUFC12733]